MFFFCVYDVFLPFRSVFFSLPFYNIFLLTCLVLATLLFHYTTRELIKMPNSPCITGNVNLAVSQSMSANIKTQHDLILKKVRTALQHQGTAMSAKDQQQLLALQNYYERAPMHLSVNLYGMSCPLSTLLFTTLATTNVSNSELATSSSASSSSRQTQSTFFSEFVVSSVVSNGHFVVLEHKSLISGDENSLLRVTDQMEQVGKRFVGGILRSLRGDKGAQSDNDSEQLKIVPILHALLEQETKQLGSQGALKPNFTEEANNAHKRPYRFVPDAKRGPSSGAGMVYMLRSNKALEIANRTSNPLCHLGAAAFTILITLSDRPNLNLLLDRYIQEGHAYLVGEVEMTVPRQLQVASAPSVGALWLTSGVSLSVPNKIRCHGPSDGEVSLSRVRSKDNDSITISDVWDWMGYRPNRLLKVKSSVVVVHPLHLNASETSTASSYQQQIATHSLAVALSWQVLVDAFVTFINGTGKHMGISLAQWESILDLESLKKAAIPSGGSLTPEMVQRLARVVIEKSGASSETVFNGKENADEANTADLFLAEAFLLSSDEENAMEAEGIAAGAHMSLTSSSGVANPGDVTTGSHMDASAGVSRAKELTLKVLESTTRSSLAVVATADTQNTIVPSERVLFVCRLNPITTAGGLADCFKQFGTVVSCEIPRDKKTGRSKCYAFVEFSTTDECNRAYGKMEGVMIDHSAIHVDFCQSTVKEEMQLLRQQREQRRLQRAQDQEKRPNQAPPQPTSQGILPPPPTYSLGSKREREEVHPPVSASILPAPPQRRL